jgi:NADPH2:quinone reductase
LKAIRIEQYGGAEVLLHQDLPVSAPKQDEVLIRVAFAGINFMDVHTRQGKYAASRTYPIRLPLTLGMEGSGEIVAVGDGVRSLKIGDRVAWCLAWGSYAEYAVVPAARVAKIADAVPFDLAAAAMFQGCTAHYLSHDVGQLEPGRTCLIHAASGGIGQLLIQFAKLAGATVYATTSSAAKAEVARRRGADHVMLYDGGRFADAVRQATGGVGVDVVFDAIGRTTLRDSFRAVRKRGLVVNYGSVSGSITDLDPIELGEAGSLFLTRPRLGDYLADANTVQHRADDVFAGLLDGSLSVSIDARYTFANFALAHAALEERKQLGKAVLDVRAPCI